MTSTTSQATTDFVLPEDTLERFRERAVTYDRENRFFAEDLEELRELGYLRAALPREHGGLGISLHQLNLEQRRLAAFAPATALGVNMHLYWTGPLADQLNAGNKELLWLAEEIVAGKVIAAGHGEPGNDLVIDDSTTIATPVDGGYRITGHKIFTSLSPAWDWLGVHARDNSDPDNPKIVHTFVRRDEIGVSTVETWDTLSVRATASHDTLLDDVFVPSERTVGVHAVGEPPTGYVAGIFPWVLPLLGNIYLGIGRRALDLAIASATSRTALSLGGESVAHKPFTQYHVAEAEFALEGTQGQLDRLTTQLTAGEDLGDRALLRLFAAKENGTRTGRTVTDLALEVAGAGALHRRNELERLYRDVRAGAFHPPNSDSARTFVGSFALGLL
ncbi:acyl-CoA dehydrogenase family protein [Gordonia sp. ABSL49_1]|uniref:acyl-CoA dehydrogenase family protein n=1 Tax=Gordonia sp. ABSL49_1 TaxID=2920941 RepID=UPI001F0D9A33|nr:acyl-CoA dehydrogenase family protein [Gordonia sp. ABSL49_1]MCH5643354.1 acyl-CoA/acyl-ACP dehydrogenase [Gordonia sp. ABSL49_1]